MYLLIVETSAQAGVAAPVGERAVLAGRYNIVFEDPLK